MVLRTKIEADEDDDFIEPEPKRLTFNPNMALKTGIFLLLGVIVILLLVMINNSNNTVDSDILPSSKAESSVQRSEESINGAVSEKTHEPSEVSEVSQNSIALVSEEPSKLKMLVIDRVVNKNREDAIKTLKSKGFKVKINEIYSDEVDVGNVVSQEPAYFTLLEEGGTITINVSLGSLIPIESKLEQSFNGTSEDIQTGEISQSSTVSEVSAFQPIRTDPGYDIPVIKGVKRMMRREY